MACQAAIAPHHNIPLVSYVALRGRCRACGARFSSQYFIIELLTGLVFAATFWLRFDTVVQVMATGMFPSWHILKPALLPWIADVTLMSTLIAMTLIDARHFIIPLELSVTGTIVGFIITLAYPEFRHETTWLYAMGAAGMALLPGACMLLVIRWAGSWYFKREAMGMGDVHLMVMLAMYMNWPLMLVVLMLSSVLGSVGGISLRLLQRRGVWQTEIPFGPYIAAGAVLAYFWGERIIAWYRGMCGL
jgi:leader peptidase (prepilin peptidase)/N-methyltransferase